MAPAPKVWNPIAPIQDNWENIKPWHEGYMNVLGGLGTVYGFFAAIALIVNHGFNLPKWPFTSDRWNPKPTELKEKEEKEKEASEEELIEDELAGAAAGALKKRSIPLGVDGDWKRAFSRHFRRSDEALVEELEKAGEKVKKKTSQLGDKAKSALETAGEDVKDLAEDVKETAEKGGDKVKDKTSEIGDKAKSAWDTVEEEVKEVAEDVKEAAEEVWDEVKGILGSGKRKSDSQEAAGNGTKAFTVNGGSINPPSSTKRHLRAVRFVD